MTTGIAASASVTSGKSGRDKDAPFVGVDSLVTDEVTLASERLAARLEGAGERAVDLVGIDDVSHVHGEVC